MNASYLNEKFQAALPYEKYVAGGTEEQQRRWRTVLDACHLTEAQRLLVGGFVRDINVLVVSGIWCGDCVQQVPLLECIAQANPGRVHLRVIDRDAHKDLSSQVRINGGDRVPVVLFLAEDCEFCSMAGDRTLRRYRSIAQRQLGAYCPLAIAPPDKDELSATLGDWLDEFERIHLMLRVSPRLRQKHGD
jgi:thiol-disulfide isomerase/thioredoxin